MRKPRVSRRTATYVGLTILVGVGIHFAYPALAGMRRTLDLLAHADVWWIPVAVAMSALSLACYVTVFQIVGGGPERRFRWPIAYRITMASQAASTVVSAGGAGAIALLFWALRKAGVERGDAERRVVAFLAFHYSVYLAALVVFGGLLWLGVLPGRAPLLLTALPAAVAAVLLALAGLAATHPDAAERRLTGRATGTTRVARIARRLLGLPAMLAGGLGYARAMLAGGRRGAALPLLAVGYWTTNIAVLWACFEAFGESPEIAGLVQAFFVGMTVNLLPLLPGGVGSVEAGMIASLLAFGEPGAEVVVSVLSYRLISFWLPTIPEAVASVQLRRTVAGWADPPGYGAASGGTERGAADG